MNFAQKSHAPVARIAGHALAPRSVKSFQTLYCAAHRCRKDEFVHHVFWQCLHRHAVFLAPLVALLHWDYFRVDRELITLAGRVRTLRELNEELRDFMQDRRNHGWWRQRVLVGLSVHRLRHLGRRFLPVGIAGWIETEG